MQKNILIAPSTEPCPIRKLGSYIKKLEDAGADWLHCDIMDGKFVPSRTYDELIFAIIRKSTMMPLDVHLMVSDPMRVVRSYAKYGANIITIHFVCFDNKVRLINALQEIKQLGVSVGISIKPKTPIVLLDNILPYVDLVLVMSVEPGKSGQEFMKESLSRISHLNKKRSEFGYNFLIEVDGGVNEVNASIITVAGADVLVSGSTIYKSENIGKTIEALKGKNGYK